jgi:hypothetical protein
MACTTILEKHPQDSTLEAIIPQGYECGLVECRSSAGAPTVRVNTDDKQLAIDCLIFVPSWSNDGKPDDHPILILDHESGYSLRRRL